MISIQHLALLTCLSFADLFVDGRDSNCASGTGTAADPLCSISSAIALASPGDTIHIAPGTYLENLTITTDLNLVGTGGASVTFVDGQGNGTSVVTIPAAVSVSIDGLTIENGIAPSGAGIDLAGELLLSNSTVRSNVASSDFGPGGILAVGDATHGPARLTIVEGLIEGNRGMDYGGGLRVVDTVLEMVRTNVQNNVVGSHVPQSLWPRGGGITAENGSHVRMRDCTFADNSNEDDGGTNFNAGVGGGLYSDGTTSLDIEGSTFSGNQAGLFGGGLYVRGLTSIVNTTISGNRAANNYVLGSGGGLAVLSATASATLNHVSIVDNLSSGYGGGLRASSGSTQLANTIVARNTALQAYAPGSEDVYGSVTSLGHNLIGTGGIFISMGGLQSPFTDGVNGDQVGTPTAPLDPMLGPLEDNGGTTETHRPFAGSPTLGAANPMNFASTDQRGRRRPQDDGPEIGAVEVDGILRDLCNGDGGDQMGCTACPCGNEALPGTIGGCLHDGGASMRLVASGSNSITAADLRIEASGGPMTTPTVLVSGAMLAPAHPSDPCFGLDSGVQSLALDGLRCVVQNLLRHGQRTTDSNGAIGSTNNGWGNPSGFFQFASFVAGSERSFQLFYRQPVLSGCQTGQNTSQAVSVTFAP